VGAFTAIVERKDRVAMRVVSMILMSRYEIEQRYFVLACFVESENDVYLFPKGSLRF
jgi:hypothetical protein